MTIGTAIRPEAELSASGKQAAMQTATTSTPSQPVIAQAGRSRMSTRVPA